MFKSLKHVSCHQVDPVPVQSQLQQLALVLERARLHCCDGVVLEEEEHQRVTKRESVHLVIAQQLQLLLLRIFVQHFNQCLNDFFCFVPFKFGNLFFTHMQILRYIIFVFVNINITFGFLFKGAEKMRRLCINKPLLSAEGAL